MIFWHGHLPLYGTCIMKMGGIMLKRVVVLLLGQCAITAPYTADNNEHFCKDSF